ncbi:MAG: BMP family ABC transporter substrate-binding protein, partial [Oscillospiraceae bacterium]|nr:BMP family ABC transporter substrate-binding protein [Oscillospiraceae bacterium]
EVQCYYEFLHYYPLTGLYSLQFTRLGSFPKLQVALGFDLDHQWTEEERRRFSAAYFRFEREFVKHSDRAEGINVAEALLVWLKVYTFSQLRDMTAAELTKSMQAVWPDIAALKEEEVITVDTGAEKEESTSIVRRLFSILPSSTLNAAFIHELRPENSTWVQGHERGRLYLEDTLGEQVETQVYYGVGNGEEAEEAMEKAIENGAEVIFATTAPLIAACRKTAAKYPNVKILNCSISMPYTGVRTYYSRIYEGKFISGAIAGAVSKRDRIGYIASSPIFGVPAGINAFALGLQMTNPRARVSLKWSCLAGDPLAELRSEGVDTISTLDIPLPGWEHGRWGLFRIKDDGSTELLASPYWDWGEFYVKLCRSIMSGTWDNLSSKHGTQAVNYWWGMSSGVIALQLEKSLPVGVETLANLLIRDMTGGTIVPFHRPITSQDGTVRNDGSTYFTTAELLHMDWLCDNVDGAIPPYELLSEKARNIVELQGIYRDRIPPKKEGILL